MSDTNISQGQANRVEVCLLRSALTTRDLSENYIHKIAVDIVFG